MAFAYRSKAIPLHTKGGKGILNPPEAGEGHVAGERAPCSHRDETPQASLGVRGEYFFKTPTPQHSASVHFTAQTPVGPYRALQRGHGPPGKGVRVCPRTALQTGGHCQHQPQASVGDQRGPLVLPLPPSTPPPGQSRGSREDHPMAADTALCPRALPRLGFPGLRVKPHHTR